MPCVVRDASAGTATFEVDSGAARPAGAARRSRSPRSSRAGASSRWPSSTTATTTSARTTRSASRSSCGPAGDPEAEVGTFIHRLPVDDGFSCEAGRTIWGFPKTVDEIDFAYADAQLTVTLRVDGELALRLTLPRGGDDEMPQLPMTTYTLIDGAPHAGARSARAAPGRRSATGRA